MPDNKDNNGAIFELYIIEGSAFDIKTRNAKIMKQKNKKPTTAKINNIADTIWEISVPKFIIE